MVQVRVLQLRPLAFAEHGFAGDLNVLSLCGRGDSLASKCVMVMMVVLNRATKAEAPVTVRPCASTPTWVGGTSMIMLVISSSQHRHWCHLQHGCADC